MPGDLESNLANLCGAIVLNLPEKDALEREVQAAAALRWLHEHSGWFLIVDNVDTPKTALEVESLLQQLDTGYVVVTSRLSQWGHGVEELSLDVISETAAQEFLLERTAGKRKSIGSDEADAMALARDLGRLPLALEQAGAFIVEDGCSFADYRILWQTHDDEVLTWHDQRSMKYPRSVATTWLTSFQRLCSDAQSLLRILRWLSSDPIPLTLLAKLTSEAGELAIDERTYGNEHPDLAICLNDLALLLLDTNRIAEAEPSMRRALAIDEHPYGTEHPIVAVRLNNMSLLLQKTNRLREAESLMRRALAINELFYGPEHEDVARDLSNLATLLQETNRLTEAEPLMWRHVEIFIAFGKATGHEHPHMQAALANYFTLLTTMGLSEDEAHAKIQSKLRDDQQ